MAMIASSRVPLDGKSQESERSPFLRVAELLAPYQPAKPLISLSLGEPQHPLPDFVGPVLARHIADFGRYPIARGIEPFRRAAASANVESEREGLDLTEHTERAYNM